MRIDDFACCSERPKERSTSEGSSLPEVQAELVETDIPFKSSRCIIASPEAPGNVTLNTPGNRAVFSPLKRTSEMAFFKPAIVF